MNRLSRLFAHLFIALCTAFGLLVPMTAHAQWWGSRTGFTSPNLFTDDDNNVYIISYVGTRLETVLDPDDEDEEPLFDPLWLKYTAALGYQTEELNAGTGSDALDIRLTGSTTTSPGMRITGAFWYVFRVETTANIPSNSEIIVRLKQGAKCNLTTLAPTMMTPGSISFAQTVNIDASHVSYNGVGNVADTDPVDTLRDLFMFVRLTNYNGTKIGYINMNTFLFMQNNFTMGRTATAATEHAITPVRIYGHPGTAGAPVKVLQGTITRDNATPPGDKGARQITFEFIPSSGPSTKRDVMIEDNGSYAIPADAIGNGTYDIAIQGLKTLRKVVTGVTINSSGSPVTLNATLIEGDTNFDNEVDVYDADAVTVAFNTVPGDADYNPLADINFDESVDVYDYAIIIDNYNTSGD